MFRRSSIHLASLTAFVIGCAAQPAPDMEAARTALTEADAAYAKAGTEKRHADFVAVYASDAAVYPPGAPAVQGQPAISAFLDAFFKDPAFAVKFPPATVQVSSDGSMGTTMAAAEITVTGADGKPVTERVRDFHVWRRQADGSWKLAVDIWNAEPPAVASAPKN